MEYGPGMPGNVRVAMFETFYYVLWVHMWVVTL